MPWQNRGVATPTAQPTVAASPGLWPRIAPWLAGLLWLVGMGIHAAGMIIALGAGDTPIGPQSATFVQYAAGTLAVLSYMSVAVILAVHHPSNAVTWIFAGIGIVAAIAELFWGVMVVALDASPPDFDAAARAAWVQTLIGSPFWILLAFLLFLVFPTGRPLSPRWGRLAWLELAATAALTVGLAFSPGLLSLRIPIENPNAADGMAGTLAQVLRAGGIALSIGLTGAAAWSTVLRYRSGSQLERQQLKWFALGTVVFLAIGTFYSLTAGLQGANPRLADVAWVALVLAAALLPLAAAIGILRYGLFDIDQIISRTFVYGMLTAILAGVYTASIRFFNWAFTEVTGAESEAALVLTTLLLATTFTPIKKSLERIVDRRYSAATPPGSATLLAPADSAGERATAASPREELDAPLPRTRAELEALIREVIAKDRPPQ